MNCELQTIIGLINAYRSMEKGSLREALKIICASSEKYLHQHLISSWRGRKNNFGDWFLNLDYKIKSQVVRSFGYCIDDKSIEAYNDLTQTDPVRALWADPPPTIKLFTDVLVFFYNHGIEKEPATGIVLPMVPDASKCYGNSKNWGTYVLSLNDEDRAFVIGQIIRYINIKHSTKNHVQ